MFGWQTDPLSLAGTALDVVVALGYLAMMARARLDGRRWPAWRAWCFLAGVASVAMSLQSGLARYDDIFWVHIVQHQLLMCVAAALLALGAPVSLVLRATPTPAGRRLVAILHSRLLGWMNRPSAAVHLPAHYLGMMYVYLLTPAYALGERHVAIHEAVHVYFLVCGLMFWAPVLGQLPSRWRPAHRTKQLMVAAGLPANLLLAALVATLGEPGVRPRDALAGATAIAICGVATTVFGLILVQVMRPRRRLGTQPTGVTFGRALLAVTRRA